MTDDNTIKKNSPYSVMDYNHLLMVEINAIAFNIGQGGTGMEQAHILRHTLKPEYQVELKEFFSKLDKEYNDNVEYLEKRIKAASLRSDRLKLNRKLMAIQREYSGTVIENVVAVLSKHNALEWKEREGLGSGLI